MALLIARLSQVTTIQADEATPGSDDEFLAAFMKELEKALEEEANNPSSPAFGEDLFATPTPQTKEKESVTVIEAAKTDDPRELFINPPLNKIKKGAKEIVQPTDQAFAACKTVCDQLIAVSSEIEKKSTGGASLFSPLFKDEFIACQTIIDAFEAVLKNIISDTGDKIYMRALLAPPEAQKEARKKLRTKMIDLLKKAEVLNKRIPSQIVDEDREIGDDLLRNLGRKSYIPQAAEAA